MGILSSIKKSIVGKSLDTLSAAFIKPVETIQAIFSPTKTIKQVIQKVDAQPLSKNITSTLVNTAAAAGVVVGGGIALTSARAGTLLPALIPATTKGKVIAAVAAPVIIGAVVGAPAKTAETILNAPTALGNVGSNIGQLIAEPSYENVKALVKENPVIVGGAVAAGALLVGKSAGGLISSALTRSEMEKQTEALVKIGEQNKNLVAATPIDEQITVVDKTYRAEGAPLTPSTQKVSSIKQPSTKKKKRTLKPINQYFTQKTNVVVQNKNTTTGIKNTKRYINKELLVK